LLVCKYIYSESYDIIVINLNFIQIIPILIPRLFSFPFPFSREKNTLGWGWSRGSQNLGGKNIYFGGGNTKASFVKLNKPVTLMDPSLNHILCSELRDQPQPGSFSPSRRERKKSLGTRMNYSKANKKTTEVHLPTMLCSH
jgi:hypothetical protein